MDNIIITLGRSVFKKSKHIFGREKETLGSFGTLREQLTLLKEKEEREEECKGLLTSSGKARKEDILCRLLDC